MIGDELEVFACCGRQVGERAALAEVLAPAGKLGEVRGKMDITFPQALRHLGEISQPTVNSDLR